MNQATLQAALGSRPLRYFESVGSTMQAALDWLNEQPDLPSGAVVIADEQTQGRGRLARHWLTPAGTAIAMSLILRGELPLQHCTMLGTVAVADVVDEYVPHEVGLRWSNDVMIGGKKVSGVLAEAIWEGDRLLAIILGIGVNVAVDFSGTVLESYATSVMNHTTRPLDRTELIAAILRRIEFWLASWRAHHHNPQQPAAPSPLFLEWRRRLITLGQAVTVYSGQTAVEGIAVEVDGDGALLVETAEGERRRFLAADVSLSPPV